MSRNLVGWLKQVRPVVWALNRLSAETKARLRSLGRLAPGARLRRINLRIALVLATLMLCECTEIKGLYNNLEVQINLPGKQDIAAKSPLSILLGTTRINAADAIIKLNLDQGATLLFQNDFGLVFSSRTYDTNDKVDEGSSAGRDSETRVKFNLDDDGENTRVAVSVVRADFPNSPREVDFDISYNPRIFNKSLNMLATLKKRFPANKRKP
jgi:hypothetical protein